jgi:hypothetical protein
LLQQRLIAFSISPNQRPLGGSKTSIWSTPQTRDIQTSAIILDAMAKARYQMAEAQEYAIQDLFWTDLNI